jgi:putative ABC transport system substrate-binding protein
MQRRNFIVLVAGAAAAWAHVARAQRRAELPLVGVLGLDSTNPYVGFFPKGLEDSGFLEGRNLRMEFRWAEGQNDRLPALAADLVRLQPAVIAAIGGVASAIAAKNATNTIPIVFATGGDPIKLGLASRLNQPSGNVTGVSFLVNVVVPKQFELLHELVPKTAVIALLLNPSTPNVEPDFQSASAAAKTLGRKLVVVRAKSEGDFESVFADLKQQEVGGLLIEPDNFFTSRAGKLAALASRNSLPAIYATRDFAEAGGLISYGTNVGDAFRQAGVYAARILRGEKPTDLPIQQSTRVEFVINLKAAKELGITVPLALLGRADAVIE